MVIVDSRLCVRCGLCAKDCVDGLIKEQDGVVTGPKQCIECGHCVAVCPQNAVTLEGYDMSQVEELPEERSVDAEQLMTAFKSRRSIRNFKKQTISEEEQKKLFETVRYTATANNSQRNTIVFVQDGMQEFRNRLYGALEKMFEGCNVNSLDRGSLSLYYFLTRHQRNPEYDFLLRNAPAVLFIANERPWDAGLASQNIENMACAMGMGVLYNGYLTHIVENSKELKEWLGISDRTVATAMLIGFPAVKYKRTVPRRDLEIIKR